jgi:hypothetical protein
MEADIYSITDDNNLILNLRSEEARECARMLALLVYARGNRDGYNELNNLIKKGKENDSND